MSTGAWGDDDMDPLGIEEMDRQILTLRAENERLTRERVILRLALRDTINAAGGQCTADVSNEFLCYAPDEVRGRINVLLNANNAEVEKRRSAEAERDQLREQLAEAHKKEATDATDR